MNDKPASESQAVVTSKGIGSSALLGSFCFRLFRYRYRVVIKCNYCGATAETLKPRYGENWLRGNDLRDGKLWRIPWVIADVLAYEFRLGRWGNYYRCLVRSLPNGKVCDAGGQDQA